MSGRSVNKSVSSWTKELKEELYNIGPAFLWRKQQDCNLRETTKIMKERCNDINRQNMTATISEKFH
jgi:hypothetical protein